MSKKIELMHYDKLLTEVQNRIDETRSGIVQTITRQKVEMAWSIGKSIEEHLSKSKVSSKSGYGKHLLEKLSNDVGIAQAVLYKMCSFYKSYPQLPQDDEKLNWTHYRVLSGVKEADERNLLEDLVRQNSLSGESLQEEVGKIKQTKTGKNSVLKNSAEKFVTPKKLIPLRGQLFSYSMIRLENAGENCIDCGFNIFERAQKISAKLPRGAGRVDVTKVGEDYQMQKSDLHPRKFNTYKAYLDRVVDGDTIRVTIDLGFEIFHKEIIRFRGINAAESGTEQGKKSAKALSKILKNIPFLVIKTVQVDGYGRYVADIFLADEKKKMSAQKVADEGVYLNQMLLDLGVVEIYKPVV